MKDILPEQQNILTISEKVLNKITLKVIKVLKVNL